MQRLFLPDYIVIGVCWYQLAVKAGHLHNGRFSVQRKYSAFLTIPFLPKTSFLRSLAFYLPDIVYPS